MSFVTTAASTARAAAALEPPPPLPSRRHLRRQRGCGAVYGENIMKWRGGRRTTRCVTRCSLSDDAEKQKGKEKEIDLDAVAADAWAATVIVAPYVTSKIPFMGSSRHGSG